MKVLVVGGGMAGLGLAGFLQNHVQVTVVEKASHWGDVGFAIMLWDTGQKLLRELGADHDVMQEGYKMPWAAVMSKEGEVLNQLTLDLLEKYGKPIVVTRTTLHHSLINVLHPNTRVFFKTTVKKLTQEQHGVTVELSNGVTEFFDLVVGADGVHSQIRDMVFGKQFLKQFGWNVWSFWSPRSENNPIGGFDFLGVGKMYVIYPMEDRAVVNLVIAGDTKLDIPLPELKSRLKSLYTDFQSSVNFMIDQVDDPAKIFHDHLQHVDMQAWHKGRVVLMGDAQHASSPLLGMGTSLALEDAYVLAQELKRLASTREIPQALENYARRRRKRLNEYRRAARVLDFSMMVTSPILSWFRHLFFRLMPTSFFTLPVEHVLQSDI